jgi:CRISPR system Cascade subunit CasE
MIASMLILNRLDCKVLKITDVYSVHRVVYDLFQSNSRDFLYIDKGGDFYIRRILILSEHSPKIPQYGEIQSKTINDSFLECEYYGFEVRLNPTKRDTQTKKRVAIRGYDNLHQWFINKAYSLGFEIHTESLEIRNSGVQTFEHNDGKIVTHNFADFMGKLKVIDRKNFKNSFCKGIGGEKGFGFGLLQIIPININSGGTNGQF